MIVGMSLYSRYRRWSNADDLSPEPELIDMAADQGSDKSSASAVFAVTLEGAYWNPTAFGYDTTQVSEESALRVPSFLECRNKVCGTIGALPLVTKNRANQRVDRPFLTQPERDYGRTITLTKTVSDLALYSVAYWIVREWRADGYPSAVERVCPLEVSINDTTGEIYVKGERLYDSRTLIQFQSPNSALLCVGAPVIKRASVLASVTDLYAAIPQMSGYFRSIDGDDPEGWGDVNEDTGLTGAETFLSAWAAARKKGTTAWVPAGLEYVPVKPGMTPAELELLPGKQALDVEITRLWGMDPEDVGISTTSRTYSNIVDRRQDFINQTLTPLMNALTERLSMGDITPAGTRVEFDLSDFLKADPQSRALTYVALINAGIISPDEARQAEGIAGPAPTPKVVNNP